MSTKEPTQGERLRALRLAHNLTVTDFSKLCGLSVDRMVRREKQKVVSVDLPTFAREFGVTVELLEVYLRGSTPLGVLLLRQPERSIEDRVEALESELQELRYRVSRIEPSEED